MGFTSLLSLANSFARGCVRKFGMFLGLRGRVDEPNAPDKIETIATTKIEWGVDMDTMSTSLSIGGGEESKTKLKGRCKSCWGGLVGRTDDSYRWTGIKCRVCGKILEGAAATEERRRMSDEGAFNRINMEFGHYPLYNDGHFIEKIFPDIDRLTEEELGERIAAEVTKVSKGRVQRQKLTRNEFPEGSPAFLMLQAKVLMVGVEHFSDPDEVSIADFPKVNIRDDGSLVTYLSMEGLKGDPQYSEYRMAGRIGSTMIESLISAFACELAMKAISLTCKDETIKTHDLSDLFADLPGESRERIKADYPEIEALMERTRQVFGKWRYFEMDVGESGLGAMIDMERAHALGKAARVIMDEAEIVGLRGDVRMDAKEDVRKLDDHTLHKYNIKLSVVGGESPPRTEDATLNSTSGDV